MEQIEQKLYSKLLMVLPFATGSDLPQWLYTTVRALILSVFIGTYMYYQRGGMTPSFVADICADVAMILIGWSFALSGICYFWDFADKQIMYRKHFGLVGFLFGLTHVIMSFIIFPEYFSLTNLKISDDFIWQFIFGVIAITIYTMMAFISNRFAVHELGGTMWRRLLRVGYIAYVFTILHYATLQLSYWKRWIELLSSSPRLPPVNLAITLFGMGVIFIRIFLWISIWKKTFSNNPPANLPPSIYSQQTAIRQYAENILR